MKKNTRQTDSKSRPENRQQIRQTDRLIDRQTDRQIDTKIDGRKEILKNKMKPTTPNADTYDEGERQYLSHFLPGIYLWDTLT